MPIPPEHARVADAGLGHRVTVEAYGNGLFGFSRPVNPVGRRIKEVAFAGDVLRFMPDNTLVAPPRILFLVVDVHTPEVACGDDDVVGLVAVELVEPQLGPVPGNPIVRFSVECGKPNARPAGQVERHATRVPHAKLAGRFIADHDWEQRSPPFGRNVFGHDRIAVEFRGLVDRPLDVLDRGEQVVVNKQLVRRIDSQRPVTHVDREHELLVGKHAK